MILYQHRVFRIDLRNNIHRNVYYLFGDNIAREGYGGQAKEMRDEPNAIGVATKVSPAMYMSDDALKNNCKIMWKDLQEAFEVVMDGGTIVIPSDGLGTGLSAMPEKCPITFKHLEGMIGWLKEVDRAPSYCKDDVFAEKEKKMKGYLGE